MTTTKKQVLILGGGYLGCHTAKHLDNANKAQTFEITLVTPRDGFLFHKIGALRAAVKGEGQWSDRVLVPTTGLFSKNKSGKVVVGTAASVDEANKTVTLQDGTVLKWDVLIVATGSRANSPGEPPVSVTSAEATKQYFAQFSQAVKQAKSVLLVGAGPVGLELAGEIRETVGNEVKIQVLTMGKDILDGPIPLKDSGKASLKKLIAAQNVSFLFEDQLVDFPAVEEPGQTWAKTPQGVELKSGKKIDCDLVVFAVGVKLNNDFLPKEWLDATTGEVIINTATFEVTGHAGVFSAGDVAKTDFTKLGYIAMGDAPVLAKNVLQAVQGKPVTNKVVRPKVGTMIVTVGSSKGRAMLPFTTLGNFMTSSMKSKDLFVSMQWDQLGAGKKHMPKA